MADSNEKPERERDMTVGFLRQRRNLIAISLAVIFYNLGDVKITRLSLLGNTVEIGNQGITTAALWLFFLYFLFRYRGLS